MCLQMNQDWHAEPVTSDTINKSYCTIPTAMAQLINMGDYIKAGKSPFVNPNTTCMMPSPAVMTSLFRVMPSQADICVCSQSGKSFLGQSDCKRRISINCTSCSYIHPNGSQESSDNCLASLHTAPAIVWSCVELAHYSLPE